MKVEFRIADGGSFRHFDMPAVPRVGDVVIMGTKSWTVVSVGWNLSGVNQTDIVCALKEAGAS